MAARTRMIVAWAVFVGWVGWLSWQSHRVGRFAVVSRAQLAQADCAVIAELVSEPDGRAKPLAKFGKIVWPSGVKIELPETAELANLPVCSGFAGPGSYVVPLAKSAEGAWRIAEVGRSPLLDAWRIPPAVYPVSDVVLRQLELIPPPQRRP